MSARPIVWRDPRSIRSGDVVLTVGGEEFVVSLTVHTQPGGPITLYTADRSRIALTPILPVATAPRPEEAT